MTDIAGTGTLPDEARMPEDVRHAFRTATQLPPAAHLTMQASLQRRRMAFPGQRHHDLSLRQPA